MAGTGGPTALFSVWDYVVFAGIILLAAAIGLFQAFRSRKDNSSAEFLLGGRRMTAVPVAMSLTASFMSGITVIGTPAEAYKYGTAFWLFAFSYTIMSTITAEIFVPLFYRLGITSTYEGGLKAVIWTDVFQMAIMLAGFIAVISRGAVLQGGLKKIWDDSYKGGRLDTFSFDPDPLRRHSFWTIVVGGSLMWVSMYAINQSQVQRYVSCKSMTHAKMSLYLNMVGLWVTVSLAMFSGLTMYSIYKDCDPFTNKDVSSSDQLLPYLVMDILGKFPGLPGLFVAAAYSGTLSTVSSSINALVAVTVEDFVKPIWPNLSERKLSWINMGMSVFFGALCISMAAIASLMGSILQAALSVFGMISGPLLGVFLLGMFFRFANSIGSLVGLVTGLAITLWVGIGAQVIVRPLLADTWYSLSYLYFCPLAMLVTMSTGLIISAITGGCKQEKINPEMFIRKEDLFCFNCSRPCTKDSTKDLVMKVEPEHLNGLDNPQFINIDLKLKDSDKITKL
ncbi:Sodium-coupled monocarboxylate transporter 1 [Bagarius yarrelli]|uniref:Sodium-coupled monocarboxylate transporter 1 n=1 Tax=Bagarius yarrelli TaxID=175774 RepID=A0A556VXU6_BAGYA|nr:Sodium-coupled monocarboxylate transporter 1 [Bagarius yarrelli]